MPKTQGYVTPLNAKLKKLDVCVRARGSYFLCRKAYFLSKKGNTTFFCVT